MTISKEVFLKTALPERAVEVPGKGEIRVRGLTRGEAKHMHAMQETDPDAVDGWMVSKCLLDPVLTPEEATAWLDGAPLEEASAVVLPILDISGLTDTAARAAYDRFRGDGRSDGVRPGREAGPDRSGASGDDQ